MMQMPVPVVSHGQNTHTGPQFDHINLRNAMVPLLSTSHDADTYVNGIHRIPILMPCDADANGVT